MKETSTAYSPNQAESRWYDYWYDQNLYDAEFSEDKTPFTIVIPPPNVTGMLTMGHILNNTIQDLYIRRYRMLGREACWIPGTDHAGIATQTKVVGSLKEQGIDFRELGREKFLEKAWEWRTEYGGIILKQLRALGVSVDWRRERFTLDEGLNQAVREVFVRLFDKGLIYRGKKIVNWSPAAQTTLSDEEVIHKEVHDKLYTIRYDLIDGSGSVQIATARPETIPGDVAIAVNPDDERYREMIGKKVRVPIGGQEIPIIADEHADPEFGTGAVKITPAHDPNDYEVGIRHDLPMPNTIEPDGTMNDLAGPLAGMDRFDARKMAAKILQEQQAIVSVEDYTHSVGFSERGGEQVEPYLSDQWFVRMEPLAGPAIKAVESGEVKFYPEHWVKTYMHWMKNIRDWPISRQLWWGHRIPVYYSEEGEFTAAHSEDEARQKLGLSADATLRQDEDVLDTWFSSWLWPFSVHGWGSSEKNERELSYFYPTDLLVTGPDIIFFWVARMIMAGIEFMEGEPGIDGKPREGLSDLVPFREVYFTSIIRDPEGRKMSKSLGNSPDPLDVIEKYGADALRFTIIYLAPTGQDVRFGEEMCELGRNFANKVWNAGRFLMMKGADAGLVQDDSKVAPFPQDLADLEPITESDRWILSRFHSTLGAINESLDNYRINDYSKRLYDFIWSEFCDWYIELLKVELEEADDADRRRAIAAFAVGLYDQTLRMLHPIMPFVTEEIWQTIADRTDGDSISIAPFPQADPALVRKDVEADYQLIQLSVEAIRRMRTEANVPPSKRARVTVSAADEGAADIYGRTAPLLRKLARIDELSVEINGAKPELSKTEVVRGSEVHVHLEGLIDVEAERAKTEKEIARLEGLLQGSQKKLANERFVENAPAEVVEREREKISDFRSTLEKLRESLQQLDSAGN